MLEGIIPIVFVPFDEQGDIDEKGLQRVVRFELDGGVDGIGINGFASEAYKLTDEERRRTVEIVASEVAGSVPLVIGIAPASTEAAIRQAREFARWHPSALMTLPPATMKVSPAALVDHYVDLGHAADSPLMVQQSPHIQGYAGTGLEASALAEIAGRATNVRYFKIEGPGAADRIADLRVHVNGDMVRMFGGGGGITLPDELRAGSSGLIPGVGFNEFFCRAWPLWRSGRQDEALAVLDLIQPLVAAVSGPGHEFSLHARKHLMQRAGYIRHAVVRRPSVAVNRQQMADLNAIVDTLGLRISRQSS
ncbi:MAG: dihydrodipicolinate synthase family protein [Anaerolineaceae bacterium]|nr:dihydrodipicolinate synthase family protein [Anaerolineaceae bacterium]